MLLDLNYWFLWKHEEIEKILRIPRWTKSSRAGRLVKRFAKWTWRTLFCKSTFASIYYLYYNVENLSDLKMILHYSIYKNNKSIHTWLSSFFIESLSVWLASLQVHLSILWNQEKQDTVHFSIINDILPAIIFISLQSRL